MKKRDFTLERKEVKRVCPDCGATPKFLGIDFDFRVQLECPKCGKEFYGHDAKVVE